MLPEDRIDQNILRYFQQYISYKNNKLRQEEVDRMALEAYDQFSIYLLSEFRARANFDQEQIAKFKQVNKDRSSSLDYLNMLSQSTTDSTLDKLLVDIFNTFVQKYFNN